MWVLYRYKWAEVLPEKTLVQSARQEPHRVASSELPDHSDDPCRAAALTIAHGSREFYSFKLQSCGCMPIPLALLCFIKSACSSMRHLFGWISPCKFSANGVPDGKAMRKGQASPPYEADQPTLPMEQSQGGLLQAVARFGHLDGLYAS